MSKRQEKWLNKPKKEFDEVLLEVRRVTRVTTWWRQLSFRAIILVWNRKGKIWLGVAKWQDVSIAVSKATHEAYKNIIDAPITQWDSIPYAVTARFKAAQIKLLPAASGTWLKAWSSLRPLLDLAWYSNILSKIQGTNNKLNNALATLHALASFKTMRSSKWLKTYAWASLSSTESTTGDDTLVTVQTWTKKGTSKKPALVEDDSQSPSVSA
jgi:small subunit ribosomal protein S5